MTRPSAQRARAPWVRTAVALGLSAGLWAMAAGTAGAASPSLVIDDFAGAPRGVRSVTSFPAEQPGTGLGGFVEAAGLGTVAVPGGENAPAGVELDYQFVPIDLTGGAGDRLVLDLAAVRRTPEAPDRPAASISITVDDDRGGASTVTAPVSSGGPSRLVVELTCGSAAALCLGPEVDPSHAVGVRIVVASPDDDADFGGAEVQLTGLRTEPAAVAQAAAAAPGVNPGGSPAPDPAPSTTVGAPVPGGPAGPSSPAPVATGQPPAAQQPTSPSELTDPTGAPSAGAPSAGVPGAEVPGAADPTAGVPTDPAPSAAAPTGAAPTEGAPTGAAPTAGDPSGNRRPTTAPAPPSGSTPEFDNDSRWSIGIGESGSFTVRTRAVPTAAISAAGLPPGLSLTDHGDGTATIAGAPAFDGLARVLLRATNGVGTATQQLGIDVSSPPAFTNDTSATFERGAPGSFDLTTTGRPAPRITVSGGQLPAGLTLTDHGDGTATIAGTATAAGGSASVTVTATSRDGSADSTLTLLIQDAPAFTSADRARIAPDGGQFTVTVTGQPVPQIVVDSALPDWLTFDDFGDGTGTLRTVGQPPAGAAAVVTLRAMNAVGADVTQTVRVSVG